MYYNYNNNIKCVSFELINYFINLNVVSSFKFLTILIIYFYIFIINLNQLNYFFSNKKALKL